MENNGAMDTSKNARHAKRAMLITCRSNYKIKSGISVIQKNIASKKFK